MKKREISSRGIVLRELTDEEVEKRLVRIKLYHGTLVRPCYIAQSKAWFEKLPDAQKEYADRMKELTTVSHNGLVETVDSLAGKVLDVELKVDTCCDLLAEEQKKQAIVQREQDKVQKQQAEEQVRQAEEQVRQAEFQQMTAKNKEESDKNQEKMAEEQKKQAEGLATLNTKMEEVVDTAQEKRSMKAATRCKQSDRDGSGL